MLKYLALVPAAGSGSRFGAETPKQYLSVNGHPLLFHTLAVLCACPSIEAVWVVLSPDDAFWEKHDWSALGDKLRVTFTGGATRAQSVLSGLKAAAGVALADDWVLVHDAARPCLSATALQRLIDELATDPVGGILAVPVADTLKRADAGERIVTTESRDQLWQAQTPQMFRYRTLCDALERSTGVTDEAGAIEALGLKPRLVRGESTNLKVTFPSDLAMAGWILRGNA
ncbi:MAG: 2-C-methyl-D-erythritol 4-phosphate cytidylyltransferase [Betaproteobacteria bacterium]